MSKQKSTYQSFSGEELNSLLNSAKDGNIVSYEELSGILREISYSYFESKYKIGKLKNIDDADDMANDVFLAFADQYENILNIENWLRRVLFLVFVNWYKKENRNKSFSLDERFIKKLDENNLDSLTDSKKALEIANTLNETKKAIIQMRFWDNLKFSEIGEKINKNESAVKKMFYRTLIEIRKKME